MAKSSRASNLFFLILYLLVPVILYCIPAERIFHGHQLCLFHNFLGVDCWGCGMTRAIFSLMYLDFPGAWEYNRLVVFVAPLLLYLYLKLIYKTVQKIRNPKSQ